MGIFFLDRISADIDSAPSIPSILDIVGRSIGNALKGISFVPFKCECIGDLTLKPGDAVEIPDKDGKVTKVVVMSRRSKGIHCIMDTLQALGGA